MKTMTRESQRRVLLLAGMTVLLFAALPAQAQEVCADIDDVPEEVTELYVDELNDEFSVDLNDADLCSKLTDNFIKACQTAVKDAAKCIQNQIKTLSKQNQTLCKALAGPDAKECASFYKDLAKNTSEAIATESRLRSEQCATIAADEYFDICLFGF